MLKFIDMCVMKSMIDFLPFYCLFILDDRVGCTYFIYKVSISSTFHKQFFSKAMHYKLFFVKAYQNDYKNYDDYYKTINFDYNC